MAPNKRLTVTPFLQSFPCTKKQQSVSGLKSVFGGENSPLFSSSVGPRVLMALPWRTAPAILAADCSAGSQALKFTHPKPLDLPVAPSRWILTLDTLPNLENFLCSCFSLTFSSRLPTQTGKVSLPDLSVAIFSFGRHRSIQVARLHIAASSRLLWSPAPRDGAATGLFASSRFPLFLRLELIQHYYVMYFRILTCARATLKTRNGLFATNHLPNTSRSSSPPCPSIRQGICAGHNPQCV